MVCKSEVCMVLMMVSPQRGWFGRMTLMVVPTPASIKCAAIQRTPREPRKANQLACRSM